MQISGSHLQLMPTLWGHPTQLTPELQNCSLSSCQLSGKHSLSPCSPPEPHQPVPLVGPMLPKAMAWTVAPVPCTHHHSTVLYQRSQTWCSRSKCCSGELHQPVKPMHSLYEAVAFVPANVSVVVTVLSTVLWNYMLLWWSVLSTVLWNTHTCKHRSCWLPPADRLHARTHTHVHKHTDTRSSRHACLCMLVCMCVCVCVYLMVLVDTYSCCLPPPRLTPLSTLAAPYLEPHDLVH